MIAKKMKYSERVLAILLIALMVFALVPALPVHATIAQGSGDVDMVVSGVQTPFIVNDAFMSNNGLSGTTVT
ncbi:MAG: hypothetical protein IK059_04605, partial [Firmicutes bacterium]|nr:hypothetical protein [Bacillota bacterium]